MKLTWWYKRTIFLSKGFLRSMLYSNSRQHFYLNKPEGAVLVTPYKWLTRCLSSLFGWIRTTQNALTQKRQNKSLPSPAVRDGIRMLGEALRSPREVKTSQGILVMLLHLLCKTLFCPKVCRHYKATQSSLLLQLPAWPGRSHLWNGLKAPDYTAMTLFHQFPGGGSTVSYDGVISKPV